MFYYTIVNIILTIIMFQWVVVAEDNIDEYKAPQLSGGEHAWDLITKDDQAIASGLYLFTVKNLDKETLSYGKIKEGKFLIIK